MKKHIIPAFCLLMVILLVSFCKKVAERNANMLGKWQGTEWVIEGKKNPDASMVSFNFNDDGSYQAQLGSGYSEIGTWRTENNKLYTTAQGKQEIMVKLLQADGKTTSFEMNRQGQKEILTLEKQ